jgi:type IV pilus assembly protein PilV
MNQTLLPRRQAGSFILEAIISLLLFAVGVISLMGLVIQGLNQVGQSKARNDASYLAGELIAEMWVRTSVEIGGQAGETCTAASTSWTCRVKSLIPTASPEVYVNQSCNCVHGDSTATGTTAGVAGACTGTATTGAAVPVVNQQPVTVCIFWTDRKETAAGTPPRLYQTGSMITRNN